MEPYDKGGRDAGHSQAREPFTYDGSDIHRRLNVAATRLHSVLELMGSIGELVKDGRNEIQPN